MINYKLMEKLADAFGVPGYEDEIANIMEKEFKKAGLKVERDKLGNVIAYKKIKKNPIVLAAHMDEIGMSVRYIDDKGFIRFVKLGGIDPRILINTHVIIRTEKGDINGVISMKPPHVMKDEEYKSFIETDKLFIDAGFKSKKEAEKAGIRIGDPIGFAPSFKKLQNGRFAGKGLDDRIGCYLLLQLAKNLPENVVLVGTAQEEVSTFGKGATIAAYKLEPSLFIAVDTGVAGDHPEVNFEAAPIALGKGPAITLIEAGGRGNYAPARVVRKVLNIAKKAKIPVQLEVISGGATDAASVYNVKTGVDAIAISVPTRYIHSIVSVADQKDIELAEKLLKAIIKNKN